MTWSCPKCKRIFKHKNQWHSCVRIEAENHFSDKDPNVKKMYEKIVREVRKFGEVNVSPVKSSIMLKSKGTFVAIKPKLGSLDIEFFAEEEINDYPILKSLRVSKRRVAHLVRLENPKDINKQLLNWLRHSYNLVSTH